jgi:DNA topoisomerase VI subunit B
MKRKKHFSRTPFTTDRTTEFFTEPELAIQVGYGKSLWPLALAKELIDNSLDDCEITGVVPEIVVTLEPDAFTVRNNGPGLTPEIVDHSPDYHVRIGVIGKEHIERPRAFRQQILGNITSKV